MGLGPRLTDPEEQGLEGIERQSLGSGDLGDRALLESEGLEARLGGGEDPAVGCVVAGRESVVGRRHRPSILIVYIE